jgi:peroxin-1
MGFLQRPQHLAVHITSVTGDENNQPPIDAYFGWTGMASASSLAHLNDGQLGERSFETLEMDPQYAQGLGLTDRDLVCKCHFSPAKSNLML